ncbi:MAG: hypothetical protein QXI12_04140 [Candidatus Methanomethyliaceae archaeon]
MSSMRERADRSIIKLASLGVPIGLVIAEEFAREVAQSQKRRITNIVDRRDLLVNYSFMIFDSKTEGQLKELIIVSPSPDFSLSIVSDGVIRVNRSYAELERFDTKSITAFKNEYDEYVVGVEGFSWITGCTAVLRVSSPTQMRSIFAVYDEMSE